MLYHCRFLFILLFWNAVAIPQEDIPPTPEAFKQAILRLKIEKSPEVKAQEKAMLLSERLRQRFAERIVGGSPDNALSMFERNRVNEFINCLQAGMNGKSYMDFDCKGSWKNMMRGDMEHLRRSGIELPDQLKKRIQDELKFLKEKDLYEIPDEVIELEGPVILESTEPETLRGIDPNIRELTTDVASIMVKLHRSSSIEEAYLNEDLIKLAEAIHRMDIDCSDGDKESPEFLLKDMNVSTEEGKVNAQSFFFGIETDKDLKKIDSHKFTEDGSTTYLYRGRAKNGNESWVMGTIDPDGKLSFRYFQVVQDRPDMTAIQSGGDIPLIKGRLQNSIAQFNQGRRLLVQSQRGLILKAKEVDAPLIGRSAIPEGKVIMGKLNMTYLTGKSMTQAHVSLEHDRVRLNTRAMPITREWALGSQLVYSPFSGNMGVNMNVRVRNLVLAAETDTGDGVNANVTYVLKQNFVNLKSDGKMTAGREFKNRRGFATVSTDFQKIHEVKLILIMK